jgi:hypothetical protein
MKIGLTTALEVIIAEPNGEVQLSNTQPKLFLMFGMSHTPKLVTNGPGVSEREVCKAGSKKRVSWPLTVLD